MRRRRNKWIQPFDSKRVLTRFGVVEMPQDFDPDDVTADQLLTNRTLKLVPVGELTETVRKVVARLSPEPLPVLHPKPELTDAQICMLQIVAELGAQGPCDWDAVFRHFGLVYGLVEWIRTINGKKVGDSLVRKGLLTADGPLLTLRGRARARAQDEAEAWRERLGLEEYRLERIERNSDPDYDEIYFVKRGRLECYFRHECFEVRAKPKIVVLANAP